MMSHFFAADSWLSISPMGLCPRAGVVILQLYSWAQDSTWSKISQAATMCQRPCWAYIQVIAFCFHNDAEYFSVSWGCLTFKPKIMLFLGVKIRIRFVQVSEMLRNYLNQMENLLAHVTKSLVLELALSMAQCWFSPESEICISNSFDFAFLLVGLLVCGGTSHQPLQALSPFSIIPAKRELPPNSSAQVRLWCSLV